MPPVHGFTIKLVSNVIACHWHADPQPSDVTALAAETTRLVKAAGMVCHFLAVIPEGVSHPTRETAAAMRQQMPSLLRDVETLHSVVMGEGATASLVRTFLRGLNALTAGRGRVFIHRNLEQALAELGKLGVNVDTLMREMPVLRTR